MGFKKNKGGILKNQRVKKSLSNKKPLQNLNYVLVLFFILFFLTFLALNMPLNKNYINLPKCGDGTFYGDCSLDKPYYCDGEKGYLIEKASFCGCPSLNNLPPKIDVDSCNFKYDLTPKNITLEYFYGNERKSFNFVVYEETYERITKLPRFIYKSGSLESLSYKSEFKQMSIKDELQREMLLPLVKEIQNLAPDDAINQARIAISLVQNIPYGVSNKFVYHRYSNITRIRYPYEVLYENSGSCGEKSNLLAFLLKEIGYGVVIFYFPLENHEAVGISCPPERSFYGSGYCFIETVGPSILTDYSMEFSDGVKLNSFPNIILISRGISLPNNLYEYRDARTLRNIKEENIFGIINLWRLSRINEKYNLSETYEREEDNLIFYISP